jgi:CBS domain containing-hemolysin-like protein
MADSGIAWLVGVWVAGVLASACLHALIAAFEQLPSVEERRLAAGRRPDGRRTIVAWLSRDPEHTSNSASVAYAMTEPIALVSLAFIAWALADRLGAAWWWGAIAAAVAGAFVALVVVRAVPRDIARAHPLGTVRIIGPLASPLLVASAPIRALVPALRRPPLAEASDVVEQAEDALDAHDVELVRSVVELGDRIVREVMVPRTDMITIATGESASHAMRMFLQSGRSRLPVVGAGVDDLVGVLYLKDLLAAVWENKAALARPIDDFARPAAYVPESLPVDDLLRQMQREAIHMAIVVDEYGGVAGLVTIEDALEEIVGEMQDEHDAVEPEAVGLVGGGYRVPARMSLEELGELFGVEIDDDDVETVAGLLAKALGRVPIAGASASAHGLVLQAAGTQGRRKRLAWVAVTREADDTGSA